MHIIYHHPEAKYGMFMYVQRLFPSSEQVCEDVLSYCPSSTSGCFVNTRGKLQGPASSPLHQRVLIMRRHSIQDDLLNIQENWGSGDSVDFLG